jgi:alkylhydroperoxidase family enzyme
VARGSMSSVVMVKFVGPGGRVETKKWFAAALRDASYTDNALISVLVTASVFQRTASSASPLEVPERNLPR